jgi:hypothetical protein
MLLRRAIELVRLGPKPDTAAAAGQRAGLRQGILSPGVHLVSSRLGYVHHGIYVGRGMVVHYAGLCQLLHPGPVEEVTLSRFSMGRSVRIVEHSESKFSPREVVLRARSRLGENEYHVLRNNCEHFCNWCVMGRSRSAQVERPVTSTLWALVSTMPKRLPLMPGNPPQCAGRAARTRGACAGPVGCNSQRSRKADRDIAPRRNGVSQIRAHRRPRPDTPCRPTPGGHR